MLSIAYSEEDKFAKMVAATIFSLETRSKKARFGPQRYVVRERVWEGIIGPKEDDSQQAAYPLRLIAVSVGPDYETLLKACEASWSEVVHIQTWKSGEGRPQRLMRLLPGAPTRIFIKDSKSFWDPCAVPAQLQKKEADARRIALQIIDTLLVRREQWLAASRNRPSAPPVVYRRPRRARSYFCEV